MSGERQLSDNRIFPSGGGRAAPSAHRSKASLVNRNCCAGLSDPGRRRARNEDRWLADPALGLYVVADGLGGAQGGEMAAQWVVDALPPLLRKHLRGVHGLAEGRAAERVCAVLTDLNRQLYGESQKHPFMNGMGAAAVCALVWERQALIVHMGDCRAYLFHDGTLEQLTRDHSTVQELVDAGRITVQQAAYHPAAGKLTRYVGYSRDAVPEHCFRELARGDRLLLCSDGLYSLVGDDEMAGIMQLDLSTADICRLLIDTANLQGGDDNITAVIVPT